MQQKCFLTNFICKRKKDLWKKTR